MGTRIENLLTYRAGAQEKGSLQIACQLARDVVRDAAGKVTPVSQLIYTGVYRDGDVQEPAQAPYVQRAMAEAAGKSAALPEGTFCFDVDRLVAAMEVADGLVRSRGLGAALVVASDRTVDYAEPKGQRMPESGAALLLTAGDGCGFEAFHHAFFPEHVELHQANLRWVKDGEKGRHTMVVVESPRYREACLDTAEQALRTFMADVDLKLDDRTILLPSQYPPGFPEMLRARMGLKHSHVVDVNHQEAPGPLTAGPLMALENAMQDGRYKGARDVIFLTVDPGITVSLALYRKG
jgi:3-oxoacyl-[acyl-carrier-protein] synthase-3